METRYYHKTATLLASAIAAVIAASFLATSATHAVDVPPEASVTNPPIEREFVYFPTQFENQGKKIEELPPQF